MADVQGKFIEPLLAVFDAPQGSDPAGFFVALVEELRYFSADALECGMRNIRRERKFRTFPSIAECVAACSKGAETVAGPRVIESAKPWRDPDREAHAQRLCRCDVGERADRQGWLPGLVEFVYDAGRLPIAREESELARAAERIMRQMDDFSREPVDRLKGAPIFPSVARLRQSMHDVAARKVFGKSQSEFRAVLGLGVAAE